MVRSIGSPWPRPVAGRVDGRLGLGVVLALTAIGVVTAPDPAAPAALAGAVLVVLAATALFLGRPPFPLGLALLVLAGTALVADGRSANLGWFAVCLTAGWCALRGGARDGIGFTVVAWVVFAGELLAGEVDPGWGAWTAGVALTVIAALAVDRQVRLLEELRAAQAELLERSLSEERNRIARDLHDVIAHSLTVSLLHVSSARLALEHDPDDAARALAEAEQVTRQSLTDVRATVGRVRDPAGVAPPAPTLADLGDLVAHRAGASPVMLEVDPELVGGVGVPATTSTTAYRIVQEALTNASRHAPGSPVRVRVRGDDGDLDVRVDSAGPPGRGRGLGLIGMRERAESVGGTCSAGPDGDGWSVHARLPLPTRA